MAVTLRLNRVGAKKKPFYRIVVADTRSPRNGRYIEQVGVYDPLRNPAEVKLVDARVDYWIGVGAVPSETVGQLIRRVRRSAVAAKAA